MGAGNNEGPNGGEFFIGDRFFGNDHFAHNETGLGGIAILEGSGQVVSSVFDPLNGTNANFQSGGLIHLSLSDGNKVHSVSKEIYQGVNGDPSTFGKSAGIGDVEIICPLPPIQIGNYIWVDANGDGIQDPCEEPVSSLTVKLDTKPETGIPELVATTMTCLLYTSPSPRDS